MATLIPSKRVKKPAYLPTPEAIAEKTAEYRRQRLEAKRDAGIKPKRKRKRRAMTKADVCNVEPADVDQLLDAIKLLTTAASHEQQTLDQQSRWTVAGKEVE